MGDNTYALSGTFALVAVGTLQPTKITANSDVTAPKLGVSHTLSGTLTDSNGAPLSGKEIDLYQYAAGQINPPDIFQKRYTDSNGHYSFVITESTSGKYTYTARFTGDQVYAYSQAAVSLTVGTLTPTTLT
jgi:protocatechuate 3,4-dioxygenase beta subunit